MARLSIEELHQLASAGEITSVIVAGVDMQGKLFGKRVPAAYFVEEAQEGIHMCALNLAWDVSLIFGAFDYCNWETGVHDMKAVPDLSTLRPYPWSPKTALVLADLHDKQGADIPLAPRNMLKAQIAKADAMGLAAFAASEIEFYLFKETAESVREKNYMNLTPLFPYPVDYSIFRLTVDHWFLDQLMTNLEAAGVPIEAVKGEWGNGQIELNVRYAEALEMADRTAIYKNGIKEMAALNQLMATFMAKQDTNDSGSSGHTHISLWDKQGNNVLFDPMAEHGLSETGRHFLGGMMALAPEMMIFYAPYVNSYKRLSDFGSGAPNTVSWGIDNRSTSFRFDGKGKSCRFENRVPGADANHYLVLTAMLASGLYGIEHKIEPPQPVRGNAGAMELPQLPTNLYDACRLLERSEIVRELLGAEVVTHYLQAVHQELAEYFRTVTDWERRKYFEFI
ncbi:glutamine synthetase family protein [Paenibacillus sp. SYP-B4298]|uniref:glutamine synthetase family protein n=1 Tax=Paenibacillus sp. SYP-B4298 TaxID=2996034 RepID=UPI0022DD40DE|nr:glutamine synthetase family protein [Paenibacillus sp. SYP-B4298]